MADPTHLLIARVHGVAGRHGDLLAAADELAASSIADDGCLGFDVLSQPAAPSELVLVTAWAGEGAMRAHFRSPAYGRYVSAVTQLLARPSDVTIHRIAGTVHPVADLSLEPERAS